MDTRPFMSETTRLVTAEELEKLPEDDFRYELLAGRLIRMSPVGYLHGKIVLRFAALLDHYLEGRGLGTAVIEVGFKLASNPDTVRAPDVAFIRRDRIPLVDPKGFWQGPPDLAVEVLSPEDRPSEIREKVEEYLLRGVTLVLVLDPDKKDVVAHRRLSAPTAFTAGDDLLEFDDIIPGFRCSVRDIFGEPNPPS
jgi:Uma2 family endonuclease